MVSAFSNQLALSPETQKHSLTFLTGASLLEQWVSDRGRKTSRIEWKERELWKYVSWNVVKWAPASLGLQTMAIMRTVGRIFNRSHINQQPTITAKHNTARVAVNDACVLLEKLESDSVTLYRLLHIKINSTPKSLWNGISLASNRDMPRTLSGLFYPDALSNSLCNHNQSQVCVRLQW